MDVLCTVKNSVGDPLVESHFIMVARCPQTGKAAPVVQLEPKTEVEMQNYERSANLSQVRFFFHWFLLSLMKKCYKPGLENQPIFSKPVINHSLLL